MQLYVVSGCLPCVHLMYEAIHTCLHLSTCPRPPNSRCKRPRLRADWLAPPLLIRRVPSFSQFDFKSAKRYRIYDGDTHLLEGSSIISNRTPVVPVSHSDKITIIIMSTSREPFRCRTANSAYSNRDYCIICFSFIHLV